MPQAATIKSLPRAFRMMKTLQAQGIEWGEDYRRAGALALKDVLEGRMAAGVDRDEMAERGAADRRNGSYRRWLMTELGEIELSVPRTRSWSALAVVRAYARRAAHIGAPASCRAVHPQGRPYCPSSAGGSAPAR